MKTLDPWTVERVFRRGDFKELKAFRILVCGRAGIGKSTLINRVFGKDMVCSLTTKTTDSLLSQLTRSKDQRVAEGPRYT